MQATQLTCCSSEMVQRGVICRTVYILLIVCIPGICHGHGIGMSSVCHRYAIGMPPGFSALFFRYVVFGSIDDNPVLLEKPDSKWCYGSIQQ